MRKYGSIQENEQHPLSVSLSESERKRIAKTVKNIEERVFKKWLRRNSLLNNIGRENNGY